MKSVEYGYSIGKVVRSGNPRTESILNITRCDAAALLLETAITGVLAGADRVEIRTSEYDGEVFARPPIVDQETAVKLGAAVQGIMARNTVMFPINPLEASEMSTFTPASFEPVTPVQKG